MKAVSRNMAARGGRLLAGGQRLEATGRAAFAGGSMTGGTRRPSGGAWRVACGSWQARAIHLPPRFARGQLQDLVVGLPQPRRRARGRDLIHLGVRLPRHEGRGRRQGAIVGRKSLESGAREDTPAKRLITYGIWSFRTASSRAVP